MPFPYVPPLSLPSPPPFFHLPLPLPFSLSIQDDRAKQWRVQAIAVAPGSFESRCPLPAAWRGLRDEELSRVSGIPGGVFVHMSGFIGGNATLEGALAMARAGLQAAA